MTQLVKRPTLGFSSGHNLIVDEIESPHPLQANSVGPAWDSVSPSASPLDVHTLSQNKHLKKFRNDEIFRITTYPNYLYNVTLFLSSP